MIIDIPGYKKIEVKNLMLDYNGTLAVDGKLLPQVKILLTDISKKINIHVVTADTFGMVSEEMKGVDCKIQIINSGNEPKQKSEYLKSLNSEETICIGNGRNDELMLKQSVLGIIVIGTEGSASVSFGNANIVCSNIIDALNLLLNPNRIIATLRK